MLEFKADLYIPHPPDEQPAYLTRSVLYDEDLRRHRLIEAVQHGCRVLQAVESELDHQLSADPLRLFLSYLTAELGMRIVVMKPKSFVGEGEWRVAYSQKGNEPREVHPGDGKPFVKFQLDSGSKTAIPRLPITGVRLGKYAPMSEDSVRALLQERGYDIAAGNVSRSEVEPDPNPAGG